MCPSIQWGSMPRSSLDPSDPLSHRTSSKDCVTLMLWSEGKRKKDNKDCNGIEQPHIPNSFNKPLLLIFVMKGASVHFPLYLRCILLLMMVLFHTGLPSVENTASGIKINIWLNLCSKDSKDQWQHFLALIFKL